MGAWGVQAFDNDQADDWAHGLDDVDDLSLVEDAFRWVETSDEPWIDASLSCVALAACEVVARLSGAGSYTDAYTEKVDRWVAAHPFPVDAALRARALRVVEAVRGPRSELRALWDTTSDDGGAGWRAAVEDLARRLGSSR